MIKNLFDNENAIFMGAKRSPDDCVIGIYGVYYDGTCSFKILFGIILNAAF